VWHEASERVKKVLDLSLVITLPEGQGLPGRVWNSKKPTWVYDVTRDPKFSPRAPYAAAADLHGGFAFPLFFQGEIDGIMELFSHNVLSLMKICFRWLRPLGSQIASIISPRQNRPGGERPGTIWLGERWILEILAAEC